MKKMDLSASVLFIAIGVVTIFLCREMKAEFYTVGPGFFPRSLSIILIFVSLMQLIFALKRNTTDGEVSRKKEGLGPLFITMLFILGYTIGNYLVGFTLSTFVFIFAFMTWLGNRKLSQKLVCAFLVTVGIKAIFKWVLVLPLPVGLWNLL